MVGMLAKDEVRKFAEECRLFLDLETEFIGKTGRAPTDEEARELLWTAEVYVWGPAGCGHCKPGYGCRRRSA